MLQWRVLGALVMFRSYLVNTIILRKNLIAFCLLSRVAALTGLPETYWDLIAGAAWI